MPISATLMIFSTDICRAGHFREMLASSLLFRHILFYRRACRAVDETMKIRRYITIIIYAEKESMRPSRVYDASRRRAGREQPAKILFRAFSMITRRGSRMPRKEESGMLKKNIISDAMRAQSCTRMRMPHAARRACCVFTPCRKCAITLTRASRTTPGIARHESGAPATACAPDTPII